MRYSLLLMLATAVGFSQAAPDTQTSLAAARELAVTLRHDLEQYQPTHPQVKKSEALISLLQTQTKLLQQPASERDKAAVTAQAGALSDQIAALRQSAKGYRPHHPEVQRSQSLINALTEQLRALQQP